MYKNTPYKSVPLEKRLHEFSLVYKDNISKIKKPLWEADAKKSGWNERSSTWQIPQEECEWAPRSPAMLRVQLQASAEECEHRYRKAALASLTADRQNGPAERGRLKLRQTQAAFVVSLAINGAVSVCRASARALPVCCFPVPPLFLYIQPWVGVSVGGLLSFFVIGSPSSLLLFIITVVLGTALLICPDFCIFMVFTLPLLRPLSVFCSSAVIAAARALRLLTLFTFRFLLFLLFLFARGFLWLFRWACFGLGLLFVAFNLCRWAFFPGKRKK